MTLYFADLEQERKRRMPGARESSRICTYFSTGPVENSMNDPVIHVVILIGGWLCVLIGMAANGLFALLNYRSFQSTKISATHANKLKGLESDQRKLEDLVETFRNRWNKRLNDEKRALERTTQEAGPAPGANGHELGIDLSNLSPSERALFE